MTDAEATPILMTLCLAGGGASRVLQYMVSDGAVTRYESSMDGWEPWQREYRFGAILIFPPEPLLSQVNALRQVHDPRSHGVCEAHVSLTVPLPGPMTRTQWRELESAAATIAPFRVHCGPLRNYLPAAPGVCLTVQPEEALTHVVRTIEATTAFADAPARRYPFSPHMTIAEFISREETERLMVELDPVAPAGTFTCTGLSYAVPDGRFHFTERRRLALGIGGAG
jgi:2'-5' RNA ligase